MIYLASPYSASALTDNEHTRRLIEEWRANVAACTAALFMHLRVPVYSPIAHNHIADEFLSKRFMNQEGRKLEFESYQWWDEYMITKADALWVLQLPWWRASRGVNSEINFARSQNKPVLFIPPPEGVIEHCNWITNIINLDTLNEPFASMDVTHE